MEEPRAIVYILTIGIVGVSSGLLGATRWYYTYDPKADGPTKTWANSGLLASTLAIVVGVIALVDGCHQFM
jgi:uncharacterized membrane-anchored protein